MASLKIHLPSKFKPIVVRGDSVKSGQTLAEIVSNKAPATGAIALYSLLEVKPKQIEKYLVKSDGSFVTKGEIIALKRGFFSSICVKSPTSGVLQFAKERAGFINIKPSPANKIESPVEGTITTVTGKAGIILDTKSIVITGVGGKGNVTANLFEVAEGGNIFKINKKVADKIVVGEYFEEAAVAKIKTLGGVGVVVVKELNIKDIPYIVIEDISKLDEYVGRKVKLVNEKYGHYLIVQ